MGGVRLLLGVVCLWPLQFVGGASVVSNFYSDAACANMLAGEDAGSAPYPLTWTQAADDQLCWSQGSDMSAKVNCDVDGKLDVQMWYNKDDGVTTPPKCTGNPSTLTDPMHLNGLNRVDAMAFLTGGGCSKQPTSYMDQAGIQEGAPYMYAKLSAPLPAGAIPSACRPDIVATAQGTGIHTVLVEALTKASLVTALQGTGPFTVFAPTDAAFTAALTALGITKQQLLDRADLADILKYHVISGSKIMAADLLATQTPTTLEGQNVTITKSGAVVKFATATVTAADVGCSNGVIHIIDAVVLPPAASSAAATTGSKISNAPAKNILGVSGGLAAFLALWFWA